MKKHQVVHLPRFTQLVGSIARISVKNVALESSLLISNALARVGILALPLSGFVIPEKLLNSHSHAFLLSKIGMMVPNF